MCSSILSAILSVASYVYFLYVFKSWLFFQLNFANQPWNWAESMQPFFPYVMDSQHDTEFNFDHLKTNCALFLCWAFHHSTFARDFIKQYIPERIERSLFVLVASALMHNLLKHWDSNHIGGAVLYRLVEDPTAEIAWCAMAFSWLMIVVATFNIDHFELVGLKQGVLGMLPSQIKRTLGTSYAYGFVRHPMMSGILCTLWLAPVMTYDRLVFNVLMTVYVVIGVTLEENDLRKHFGSDEWEQYQENVPNKFFWLPVVCPVKRKQSTKKQN
eukprot:804289_1